MSQRKAVSVSEIVFFFFVCSNERKVSNLLWHLLELLAHKSSRKIGAKNERERGII